MKIKKLMLLVLTSMAMGVLAGCGKQPEPTPEPEPEPAPQETMPDEYSLLDNWAGNTGEEVYTVTKNAAGATVITYADAVGEENGGWEYVKRSFAYDAAKVARFNEYKKVIFEGNLVKTSGSDIVMVKVEGSDGNQWEKRFTFASEVKTYEFGLSFVSDWTKVSQILFFVNRSTNESGSGVITLTKLALSKAEVVPANDIAPGMPSVPQGYAIYDAHLPTGEGHENDKVDVMYHWGYSSDGGIKAAEPSQGYAYKFSWGVPEEKTSEWDYISSKIKNGSVKLQESGLKRIVFEIKGTKGQTGVFKFQSEQHAGANVEKQVKFSGEDQVVAFNIDSVLAHADVAEDTNFMALIFPDGGVKGIRAVGSLEIKAVYMDRNVYKDPVNEAKWPQMWLDNPVVVSFEYDHAASETVAHRQAITWKKSAPSWQTVQYKVDFGDKNALEYRRVVGTFTASANVHVLIKGYDSHEKWINLTKNTPASVDYVIPEANVDVTKNMCIFVCTNEDDALSGTLTIDGLRLTRETTNVEVGGVVRLNRYQPAGNEFAIKQNLDEDLEIAWNKSEAGYAGIQLFVSSTKPAGLTTIKGTLVADHNVHVILKPADNGGNEKNIALTENTPVEVSETFENALNDDAIGKVVIMVCVPGDTALSGNVVLQDLVLTDGEHDLPARAAVAPKDVEFHGFAKTAGETPKVLPVDAYFAANGTPTIYFNGTNVGATGIKFYTRTGGFEIATVGMGTLSGKYDAANHALLNLKTDNATEAAKLDSTYPINLTSEAVHYTCDGTTSELQEQFMRRYWRPGTDSGWAKDTGNADRIVSETTNVKLGSALALRKCAGQSSSGEKYRVALALGADFAEARPSKSLSFWVYNPTDTATSLRMWVYTKASFAANAELTKTAVTVAANGWTYVQAGFSYSIYNFQIANFNGFDGTLVFDEIILI